MAGAAFPLVGARLCRAISRDNRAAKLRSYNGFHPSCDFCSWEARPRAERGGAGFAAGAPLPRRPSPILLRTEESRISLRCIQATLAVGARLRRAMAGAAFPLVGARLRRAISRDNRAAKLRSYNGFHPSCDFCSWEARPRAERGGAGFAAGAPLPRWAAFPLVGARLCRAISRDNRAAKLRSYNGFHPSCESACRMGAAQRNPSNPTPAQMPE